MALKNDWTAGQEYTAEAANAVADAVNANTDKLDTVEENADVTDATNVDAAGAVMNSDTSTAAMQFVVDEDNMASNSATKVPTQQSVKAYVDNSVANAGGGDMLSATYDPQEIGDDAFDRANHTGEQAISTVTGLQTALNGKVSSGGALGTPSSGVLTNCTGLPVSGIAASTSTALGVGSLEVGHASDTTVSRLESGVVGVEGQALVRATDGTGLQVWVGTESEYDGLGSYDSDTIYLFTE